MLTATALRQAIETGEFRIEPKPTELGRFPELAIKIDLKEVLTLGFIQSNPPRASVIDGTTNIRITGCLGVRKEVEIACRDADEADMLACVLDQDLQIAFAQQVQ